MPEIARKEPRFGVVSTTWPPGFKIRFISVIIWESIFFGIEQIHVNRENFVIVGDRAPVHFAGAPVVAAPHLAISKTVLERGRDLQIYSHLENPIVRAARRCDG